MQEKSMNELYDEIILLMRKLEEGKDVFTDEEKEAHVNKVIILLEEYMEMVVLTAEALGMTEEEFFSKCFSNWSNNLEKLKNLD